MATFRCLLFIFVDGSEGAKMLLKRLRVYPPSRGDYALFAIGWLVLPILLIVTVYAPSPILALLVAEIGGAGLFVLASIREGARIHDVLNPRYQAWSVALGDTLALSPALALIAHARATTDADRISTWPVLAIVGVALIALFVGHVFHEQDRPVYAAARRSSYMECTSKLDHDYRLMPVFVCAFVVGGIPLLQVDRGWPWHWNWSGHVVAILVLIAIWGALGVRDRRHDGVPWVHMSVPGMSND